MSNKNRVAELYDAVIAGLKPILLEHNVTQAELKVAGHFIDRLGKADLSTNLLNVAFSMAIVDKARRGLMGTREVLEGPYYQAGAPDKSQGTLYDTYPGENAQFLEWSGRLLDAETGQPLPEGEVDIWHANENGKYDHKGFHLRGIVRPKADGSFTVRTIVPLDYSEHGNDPIGELYDAMGRSSRRSAHIHVKARAPGHKELTTQLFVPWSDFLDSDYVEGAVSPDLVLSLKEGEKVDGRRSFSATFDLKLDKAGK